MKKIENTPPKKKKVGRPKNKYKTKMFSVYYNSPPALKELQKKLKDLYGTANLSQEVKRLIKKEHNIDLGL